MFRIGDKVKYVGTKSRPDVTYGKIYTVNKVLTHYVEILDDIGDEHEIEKYDVVVVEPAPVERPDWLVVYHDGDVTSSGGRWAGVTVYDKESSWYCFRNDAPDTKDEYMESIKFVNEEKNLKPLDAYKAAMMLLVFAEEEEKLL